VSLLAQSVKSILYFVILIAFTDIIMPNARYKKYIKMVMGLILILMILTPLAGFLGGKGLGAAGYSGALAGLRAAESSAGAAGAEPDAEWRAMLKTAFDEQVKAQLRGLAADEGLELLDASVGTNADITQITRVDAVVREAEPENGGSARKPFIRIEPVTVGGAQAGGDAKVEALKKSVSDFYKIAANNIYISVQKKN